MKLVLKVNERLVGSFGELDVTQDTASEVRSDLLRLRPKLSQCESGSKRRTLRTSGAIVVVIRLASPPFGYTNLYCGGFSLPKYIRKARAMPSMQSRSYLEVSREH